MALHSLIYLLSLSFVYGNINNEYTINDDGYSMNELPNGDQEEIYRRWLAESGSEHTSDHASSESNASFSLSHISQYMDPIIAKYEEYSEFVNSTDSTDDTTHSHRRRSRRRMANTVNEGSWDCETVESMIPNFGNVSYELHEFEENYCAHHEHEHHHHVPDGVYLVLYCGFVLFTGCLLKYVQHRFHVPLPYTVLLLLAGVIFEVIELHDRNSFGHLNAGFIQVREIDPHMVLSLFIPGLIFESAFNTNYHIFLKEAQQAAMLAGPGVVVNSLLIGGVMHYFAHAISLLSYRDDDGDGIYEGYDWSWSFCIMFGSIVSATDPVAVVALLKELGASKRLSTLIEAESLLNDGTAFVIFTVLKVYAASPSGTTVASMLGTFVQLAFGGASFGILAGFVCCYILSSVYNDHEIEITLTLAFVYLFAYTADFVFKFSGVLTIVFMGLWVSKQREAISPHVEHAMHTFWEMIGFIANTLLFFLTGQVIAFSVNEEKKSFHWPTDLLILFVLYICCHISRALAIWQMYPVLKNTGYGCTMADSIVMVYGGLRGAIGLALALIVETEARFDDLDRDRVLFHVCGIVTLTLTINAPTVKYVVQYLGLDKPPTDTAALFKSATQHLIDDIHHKLNDMKHDKHYTGANWMKVEELQPQYAELYKSIFNEEMNADECDINDELSVGEDGDLIINMLAELQRADRDNLHKQAVEKRVIQVMKSSYWTQYEKGLISADAVNILVESSEDAMDNHDLTKQRKNLKKWFSIPWYIKAMHQSSNRYIREFSAWLLFGNLGFAVEIASGFVYASKAAFDFCSVLRHNNSIDDKHVEFVQSQLSDVTNWITLTGQDVVRVYPEVHTAIQTKHAAHSLMNYQKEEIDHLLHKGFLDEAEHGRVMACCEESLNGLFHTSYSKLLDKNHDEDSILLQSPLFSELTDAEKTMIVEKAKPSRWFKKGEYIVKAGNKTRKLFVITRGTVFVYKGNRTHIHTKERGDVLDVYAMLQDDVHDFNFMVSTDTLHGYWLDMNLLRNLKDSNIDFWDSLWKCAACDVMRFYFDDSSVMRSVDKSELDSIVYQSPLSFFDPHNRYRCEIRVNRGVGVLLNGQVVHITDMNTTAFAPAVLPVVDEPYVAIEESVVLYLDCDRNELADGKMNPKLAKLMGLNVSAVLDEDENEYSKLTDDEKDDDLNEQEKEFLSGGAGNVSSIDKESTTTTVRKLKSSSPKHKKQKSNLRQLNRYRSRGQLNKAGRAELYAELNEELLPKTVSTADIDEEWSLKESFEVIKYIISRHEGLFEHVKKFHIKNLQDAIVKQTTIRGDMDMDDEEAIDSDAEAPDSSKASRSISKSKTFDLSSPSSKKKSFFARPSGIYNNGAPLNESSQMGPGGPSRKGTLTRYGSSRYMKSQQNLRKRISGPSKLAKAKSDSNGPPAQIIKAKGYSGNARRGVGTIEENSANYKIDGWETVRAENVNKNASIMALGISSNNSQSGDSVTTPLTKMDSLATDKVKKSHDE